jgi:mediator of RNA polymerase II transcription subunit 18
MSAVTQSQAHAYEVALFGEFFPRDLRAVLNRLTLHTESAALMHTREIVFEHIGAQVLAQSGSQGEEPVLLRARKELGDGKESGW